MLSLSLNACESDTFFCFTFLFFFFLVGSLFFFPFFWFTFFCCCWFVFLYLLVLIFVNVPPFHSCLFLFFSSLSFYNFLCGHPLRMLLFLSHLKPIFESILYDSEYFICSEIMLDGATCCVFRPAFRCCKQHFFQPFSTYIKSTVLILCIGCIQTCRCGSP